MNIERSLKQATSEFRNLDIKSASLDARLLLAHTLDKSIEYLLLNPECDLRNFEIDKFHELVSKRCDLIPLPYILGFKEFYGRKFEVNNKVLIPRPDTETLITAILASSYAQNHNLKMLELGVGSGCIIISLLLEIISATGIGCDIEPDALLISKNNAKTYGLVNRIKLILSNWFESIEKERFDIIVSNPPYIAIEERELMSKETLLHEPASALFAGHQGLEAYENIASKASSFIADKGSIFLEVGFSQADQINNIFSKAGFFLASITKDLSGYDRVLQFKICD
ncbi:MAG: peptide chain release factor N(5)-glutamine methyltransferase [Janthinobacterium lividum]